MENKIEWPVVDFINFCKNADDIEQIRNAIKFYDEPFNAKNVIKYFKNWELELNKYKNEKILTNKHSNGEWESKIHIFNIVEYMLSDDDNWLYVPKTMGEFISDVLRHEDFELIFKKKTYKMLYGNKNDNDLNLRQKGIYVTRDEYTSSDSIY